MDRKNLEDVYPLSPLQHGLLFHAVLSEGAYWEQFPLLLEGGLDADALERAFRGVVARHPALRTGFAWENRERPLQVVFRHAEPPAARHDWTREADWRAALAALLEAGRARPRDLRRAPLAHLDLARVGDERWVMVLGFHHLVIDGWSLPLVLGDLLALYQAEVAGRPAALPPAPRYRDYVAWLLARGEGADERFWRGALRGFGEPTPLPLDRGTRGGGAVSAQASLLLGGGLEGRLAAAARERGVTAATLAQAAWALVLARHAGADDVVFGATVSGRPAELPGVEHTVGLFINTVPVRVRLDARAPVGEWLRALHRGQTEAREHGHARLVDVHGWSEVPRERPLFESLLVYENYPTPGGGDDDGQLLLTPLPGEERTNYALTLVCAPAADGMQLRLTYDGARFGEPAARRILAATAAALEAVAGPAERTVAALSVLTPADRELLASFNPAPTPPPEGARIHDAFLARAEEKPEAVAVVHGHARVTYGELQRRSAAIARALRARGVGAETRVGVCLERTPELVAALLGVLRAGGTYVPLDPAYPAERLALMLDDSAARVVVTHSSLAGLLPPHAGETLRVDGELPAEGEADGAVDAGSGAYLIYTSGSTGRPKGVLIEHASAVEMIGWARALYPAGELEGVLAATSVCFDLSVFELFVPLAAGTKVILAENALALPTLAARDEVTLVNTVPSAMAELVRGGGVPAPVRVVNLAGEPLPRSLVDAVFGGTGAERVYNLYGPSEDTTYSTWARVPRDPARPVTIGRPVANTRAWVVDGSGALAPVGAAGELCLAGAGLARGYLGRPALTAEKWVPEPFSGIRGARMYRTGDLARWREDGELEYLGRIDRQVKVRGFRIEPGEVEEALRRHAGAVEAAVVAREDLPGGRRLVGYVVPGERTPAGTEAIRAALGEHLPEHMVPAAIVVLGALPLTPSGKVDRGALPDPEPAPAAAYVEPRTDTERALAAVWREVLGIGRVGAEDSFFAAGGHSLLAMQAAGRIRAALEIEVPLRVLFDHPRLAELAAWIDAQRRAELEALLAELDTMSDEEAAALAEAGGRP